MATAPAPNRGEIWLVNFDPSIGGEITKVRPALVIGRNSIGWLPLRIVVPLTDWKPHFATLPWFIEVAPDRANGLAKKSGADAFQVKSVSITRFVRRIGDADRAIVGTVAKAIAVCVGAI